MDFGNHEWMQMLALIFLAIFHAVKLSEHLNFDLWLYALLKVETQNMKMFQCRHIGFVEWDWCSLSQIVGIGYCKMPFHAEDHIVLLNGSIKMFNYFFFLAECEGISEAWNS